MRERHVDFEPFISAEARFTDDTLLTAVVAGSLLGEQEIVSGFKDAVHAHPRGGFGRSFREWALSNSDAPYESWGNGAAMRVSGVGGPMMTYTKWSNARAMFPSSPTTIKTPSSKAQQPKQSNNQVIGQRDHGVLTVEDGPRSGWPMP